MSNARKPFNRSTARKPAKGALMGAAERGEAHTLRDLLARGATVDERDEVGMTPLMAAASKGEDECLKLLIAAGADVNAKDIGGDTVLTIAVDGDEEACARILIQNGAEIDAPRANGMTPLVSALRGRLAEVALMLINEGTDVNQKTPDGEPALVFSITGGPILNLVSYGLVNKGADLEATGPANATPLICAAYCNNSEVLRYLIKKGAKLDPMMNGETALDIARHKGYPDVADILLQAQNDRESRRNEAIQKAADGFREGLAEPMQTNKPFVLKPKR